MTRSLCCTGVLLVVGLSLGPAMAAQEAGSSTPSAATAELTRDEMRTFLLTATVVRSRDIGKGVTRPKRLTLSKDGVTHDAAFQSVDERKMVTTLTGGGRADQVELNFVDHYRYNVGAYAIAELLGLDPMMPVHVERRWDGKTGSLSWWVDTLMDEGERLKKKVQPPSSTDWNQQMYRMRVFAALTRDTDRNLGNVLITPQWKVVMIDFTRAFRPQTDLLYPQDLPKIDRNLLPRLEGLTREAIATAVGSHLMGREIEAVLGRRDVIVAHFRRLISLQGESVVLY